MSMAWGSTRRYPHRYAAKNRFGPDRIPRSSRFLHCLARVDSIDQSIEDDQANVLTCMRHRRHVNATRLHHRRNHPRRHHPDGPGAPTPGDAADGVVVAAPAPQGISSELGALAALHQKGALTDGEFAAAKAKLLG